MSIACPYCGGQTFTQARTAPGATEWECTDPTCRRRHTRKDHDPDHLYYFWPGDIEAAASDEVKPLFPDLAGRPDPAPDAVAARPLTIDSLTGPGPGAAGGPPDAG